MAGTAPVTARLGPGSGAMAALRGGGPCSAARRDRDPLLQLVAPPGTQLGPVCEDPVALQRLATVERENRAAPPGERAREHQADVPSAHGASGHAQAVDAHGPARGDIDDGVAQVVLLDLDPGHAAARSPVEAADAGLRPIARVGPVLGRRDRELRPERRDPALQVLDLPRGAVIVQEDVSKLALAGVGPF